MVVLRVLLCCWRDLLCLGFAGGCVVFSLVDFGFGFWFEFWFVLWFGCLLRVAFGLVLVFDLVLVCAGFMCLLVGWF